MVKRGRLYDVYCNRCTFVFSYDEYFRAMMYDDVQEFFWQFMAEMHDERRFDNAAAASRS